MGWKDRQDSLVDPYLHADSRVDGAAHCPALQGLRSQLTNEEERSEHRFMIGVSVDSGEKHRNQDSLKNTPLPFA